MSAATELVLQEAVQSAGMERAKPFVAEGAYSGVLHVRVVFVVEQMDPPWLMPDLGMEGEAGIGARAIEADACGRREVAERGEQDGEISRRH